MELDLKADTTKTTTQQRFVINTIYDSSFALNALKGGGGAIF